MYKSLEHALRSAFAVPRVHYNASSLKPAGGPRNKSDLTSLDWIAQGAMCKNALESGLNRNHLAALGTLYTDHHDDPFTSSNYRIHLSQWLVTTIAANPAMMERYTLLKWSPIGRKKPAPLRYWATELSQPISTLSDTNRRALKRLRDLEQEAKLQATTILANVIDRAD